MKCTNCGNEVPESANVCGYCGHRLKAGAPVSAPQPVHEQPPTKMASAPAAQSGVWLRFGVLLLGAVLITLTLFIFISGFIINIPVSILLAIAAVVYWRNERRGLGCFIGAIGLGLLMAFIIYLPYLPESESPITSMTNLGLLLQIVSIPASWVAVVWALIDALGNR